MRRKGVEVVEGVCFEKSEKLIECFTIGTGGDQAEEDMDGKGRKYSVGVWGFLGEEVVCECY